MGDTKIQNPTVKAVSLDNSTFSNNPVLTEHDAATRIQTPVQDNIARIGTRASSDLRTNESTAAAEQQPTVFANTHLAIHDDPEIGQQQYRRPRNCSLHNISDLCCAVTPRIIMGTGVCLGLIGGVVALFYKLAPCSAPELPCRNATDLKNLTITIEGCDPCTMGLIKASYNRISDNIEQILNQDAVDINSNNRAILDAHFDKETGYATYVCHDGKACSGKTAAFVRLPTHKNTSYLCMNNIQNSVCISSELACQLDKYLMHEAGHIANVTKYPNHNNGPNGDPVYRLGWAAEQVCQENLSRHRHLFA